MLNTEQGSARSRLPLRLPQPGNPVSFLPLTSFLEQLNPFKAFEDIAFAAHGGRRAQTAML